MHVLPGKVPAGAEHDEKRDAFQMSGPPLMRRLWGGYGGRPGPGKSHCLSSLLGCARGPPGTSHASWRSASWKAAGIS